MPARISCSLIRMRSISSCTGVAGRGANTGPIGSGTSRPVTPVHDDIDRILISEQEIRAGIDRIAAEVTRAYAGRDFTVVAVLKGSCVFASDLIRRIPVPLELAFLAASSFAVLRAAVCSGVIGVSNMPCVSAGYARDQIPGVPG